MKLYIETPSNNYSYNLESEGYVSNGNWYVINNIAVVVTLNHPERREIWHPLHSINFLEIEK